MSTITEIYKIWKTFFSWKNYLNLTATSQNQLLELVTNEGIKIHFENMPILASFYIKVKNEYPELDKIAFKEKTFFKCLKNMNVRRKQ